MLCGRVLDFERLGYVEEMLSYDPARCNSWFAGRLVGMTEFCPDEVDHQESPKVDKETLAAESREGRGRRKPQPVYPKEKLYRLAVYKKQD